MKIEFRLKKANKNPEVTIRKNRIFFNFAAFYQLTNETCDVRNFKLSPHSQTLFRFDLNKFEPNGQILTLKESYGKRYIKWKNGCSDGKYKLNIKFPFAEIGERIV